MRLFQSVTCLLYLVATATIVALSMRASDGHLIYTLDDPYIHLALAENILRGGYGVNLGEFSSPSSSIGWPFLLVIPMFFGLADWGPLAIGVLLTSLSVWLVSGFIWQRALGPAPRSRALGICFVLSPLLLLSMNAVALPMTGMEHPLHILGTVLVVLGLTELAEDDRVPGVLVIGILLCPLARFEGLALSVSAIGAIASRRRFGVAAALSGALIVLIGAYALFMHTHGMPVVPSSVLVKSPEAAAAMDGGILPILQGAATGVYTSLGNGWGVLFAASSALLLLAALRARHTADRVPLVVGIPAIVSLGAHMAFGRYGWFGRYEVYAVVLLVLSIVAVYSGALRSLRSDAIRTAVLATLLALPASGYLSVTLRTPAASRAIFEQQYQMHRFATAFFPHPVAVNDLGWVAYRNDHYVLDLWGLGSEESRRLAREGKRTSDAIQRMAGRRGIRFAMLYDDAFGNAIPASWCRIAVLRTSRVAAARDSVAFYLLAPEMYPDMMAALSAFRLSLPSGAKVEISGCPM